MIAEEKSRRYRDFVCLFSSGEAIAQAFSKRYDELLVTVQAA